MPEQPFTPGQRWVSDTEPELGLGSISGVTGRTIDLHFTAASETRRYAIDNAPLTRVQFQPGDTIEDVQKGTLLIDSLEPADGLITYRGTRPDGRVERIPETSLSPFIQFNRPQIKLFAGQLDENIWFELRKQTLEQRQRLEQSDLIGLGGARTELLNHQVYIAHEVGHRLAPRVLLADEVGLGKTIEACLILHRQLLTGRAHRALIVVPAPLLHQWLVELLRRFNLNFSLFDEQRYADALATAPDENPFLGEQLVLCSLDLLIASDDTLEQACQGEWDMLIVDEAHHLEWHETVPSPAYQAVEALAYQIPGVLLLTATPEQLGPDGHFARLRLLDPDRFPSRQQFQQEQTRYRQIADVASALITDQPLTPEAVELLHEILDDSETRRLLRCVDHPNPLPADQHEARDRLTNLLLDRHGTGRAMFRNTRDRIKGFAPRVFHGYPLPLPEPYREALAGDAVTPRQQLHPEQLISGAQDHAWWQMDPRVDWLINLLRRKRQEKFLLICSQRATAIALEAALRIREGIPAALFHESLSIIERDRSAAWFADPEQGSQILLCSEIGSEGRNFQFAHHLILFDLPENPDLLEQRIGRLDRIGQTAQVELHVPYFTDSAQEVLMRWYHEGLNAFVHTCQSGPRILQQLQPALYQAFEEVGEEADSLTLLLDTTRQLHRQISAELKQGRDHLLELNSCREPEASQLVDRLVGADRDSQLPTYMQTLFDAHGIESEPHSSHSLVLKPGQQMLIEQFPGLPAEGVTVTYDRGTALIHEERQFLTWEHPMVLGGMHLVLESGRGNCTASGIRHPAVPPGTLALELLFVLECPAPKLLQAGRFLPPTLLHLIIDQNLAERGPHGAPIEASALHILPKPVIGKIVTPLRQHIQRMIERAEQRAAAQSSTLIEQARQTMRRCYGEELDRLTALSRVNPAIKPEEISLLREHQAELERHLASSRVRLDSIRLLVGV